MYELIDYLEPINIAEINDDNGYNDGQFGANITIYKTELPDISNADIILIGIAEKRGGGNFDDNLTDPNLIRKQLYQLHYWHKEIKIVDVGNIKIGMSLSDSYAAAKLVLTNFISKNKIVVIIGGSHDITITQYYAHQSLNQIIEATCIDACINLRGDTPENSENFLMEMLTSEPNFIKNYNHIGFQSYLVHPHILETMDKLHFDCFRLGVVKENIEEIEPILRNSNLISFDICAIKNSDAPSNYQSPNGFTGEEACMIAQFAGMSNKLNSFGIYGYLAQNDTKNLTAKQIAQMIWYFIDGIQKGKQESDIENRNNFNEYHCTFTEIETVFLQSKKTGRWWMKLPNKKFIACSYKDYVTASHNEIPTRWFRAQERE